MKKALQNENRTYGIEIEMICSHGREYVAQALRDAGVDCQNEGYNHRRRSTWKIMLDASVGYADNCMELVSPPLKGQAGLEMIEKVCKVLNTVGAKVNKKCGLHVHHDANDFTTEKLSKAVHVYSKIEAQLDKMMPASRRENANYFLRSTVNRANQVASSQLNGRTRSDARYAKINVNAYFQHGTIEFRHHSGTVDADKIIAWTIITQRIVERCATNRKAPSKEITNWRSVMSLCGIGRIAFTEMNPGEAELVKWSQERIKEIRANDTRRREREQRRARRLRRARVA